MVYVLRNNDLGYLLAASSYDCPHWQSNLVNAVKYGLWAIDNYDIAAAMADRMAEVTSTMVSVLNILRLPCYDSPVCGQDEQPVE